MRILGIDYGDARVGIAITDALMITVQGLKTIHHDGNDKIVLKRLDEILLKYNDISTFVVGMPFNMNGTSSQRMDATNKFIHKLKCKYNKINIITVDERLTTVAAHRTMNELNINKKDKKNIVDTISAEYILEMYINKMKGEL